MSGEDILKTRLLTNIQKDFHIQYLVSMKKKFSSFMVPSFCFSDPGQGRTLLGTELNAIEQNALF